MKKQRFINLPFVLFRCEIPVGHIDGGTEGEGVENGVLRGIFGPKGKDTTEQWRKEHVEELSDLYRSANIYRLIQSRKMNFLGHVARMGSIEIYTEFWWVIIMERVHREDPGINRRIILKWIYGK